MHMADALLSPAVGGALWAATAVTVGRSAVRLRREADDRRVPLMGVLGAFVFAAQMVNFTIPGTGSSGHLGGGLLLAILLGPEAALLVVASVLTVQALFFADGGLLALGANVFNLGFLPCYLAYPLVYRPLAGAAPGRRRAAVASVAAAVVGLQLGAFGVVAETVLSGISDLPFRSFLLLMQPIHLAIGVVEGLVTAAVVSFVWKAQPGLMTSAGKAERRPVRRKVLVAFGGLALVTGGALSLFASTNPDGLEWAVARVTGGAEVAAPTEGVHGWLEALQDKVAVLPDYALPSKPSEGPGESGSEAGWVPQDGGTSLAGVIGGTITLALAFLVGWVLRRRSAAA